MSDSLETIYKNEKFDDDSQLVLLYQLTREHTDLDKKIFYCDLLISTAKAQDSSQYFYSAYLEKGNALSQKGDYSLAIDNFLEAGEIAIKENNKRHLGMVYASVANVYQENENPEAAITYYKKALVISRELPKKKMDSVQLRKDSIFLASTIENIGAFYVKLNKPDSALLYLNKSGELFERLDNELLRAYNLANKGMAYAESKDYARAEQNINKSLTVLKSFGHHSARSELLIEISEFYLINDEFDLATEFAYRGLNLAKVNNLKPQISEAYLLLSKIYEKTEGSNESLAFYKNYVIYRDSVKNLSSIQQIANLRTDFEVSQKQSEVDFLNQQKKTNQILVFTMMAILLISGLYFINISKAKKRSDELLLNILPSKTADELKQYGKVKAKKFESVTVMFTDFQAFTKYSQKLSPEKLVKSVDFFFSEFDRIIEKYKLEKIKTIGDAYMCAGGLSYADQDHAERIILAASEIIDFMNKSKKEDDNSIAHFDIRIGVNSGPVVAGVVGEKKFAYDIWGDTVNVASRMESNSKAGMINISEDTYQLVKPYFSCVYRGEIEVKNKGKMKMYFVKGTKISTQIDGQATDKRVLC